MNPMQILGMLPQFKSNPIAALSSIGLNVPSGIVNNPQQIADYLVRSGQIPQDKINQAMSMARQMGIKL